MKTEAIGSMKKCVIFKDLPEEDLTYLADQSTIQSLKRGDFLFRVGSPAKHVYIILIGSAKLVRSNPDGKERIVHLLLMGDMFGAAVAMQNGHYPVDAIALEQSLILEILTPNFQEVFLKHPTVGQALVSQMSERMQQAHEDRINAFDSVEKRITHFLLDLLRRVQIQFGNTTRIPIPLTRQDIANRVGTTVESVIRTISHWQRDGLLITHDKYIEIPHPEILHQSFLS